MQKFKKKVKEKRKDPKAPHLNAMQFEKKHTNN